MKTNNPSFANMRAEMKRKGYTIKQLALRLGIATNTLNLKINGHREFLLCEVEAIANILDCSIDYLVGYEKKASWAGFLPAQRKER